MNYKIINGNVTAASGFKASGVHCGLKKDKNASDLALIYSEVPCYTAGMYTKNKVKSAPIYVTKEHLENNIARAIVCNSGNANACNGDSGLINAKKTTEAVAKQLKIDASDVLVGSTGVIGVPLKVELIENAIPTLVNNLCDDGLTAAKAIMTTDTYQKECTVEFNIGGKTVKLGGIAKGSGMIEPNMGTMLCFITTDLSISPELLKEALSKTVNVSFNRISVDGDTSTNDTVLLMANGLAENPTINEKNKDYDVFVEALEYVCISLARKIAKDGEGATKLIECKIVGAKNEEDAVTLAKSVVKSSLVKAAIFGSDANWGRVLCALGYSGADFDPQKVNVFFESKGGSIMVCKNGEHVDFSEDLAKKILLEDEIMIRIELSMGDAIVSAWGCDLTYDYVKINGDYRS